MIKLLHGNTHTNRQTDRQTDRHDGPKGCISLALLVKCVTRLVSVNTCS